MSRGYRWTPSDNLLREAAPRPSLPANKDHHGACKSCGADTSRNVTAGGPGHPRNGWECVKCGEHYMALELLGTTDYSPSRQERT